VRVVTRMRRSHAFAAASALFAVSLLAVLPATLIHSELAATSLLVGVAIVFAIGECVHTNVLGPLVADMAPAHLLGRYLSIFSLSFTTSVALGPAIGGFSSRPRQTPSGGVVRWPRCWREPSCFDSAAAFPTHSAKNSQVLGRHQRPREVLPRERDGGLRRMSRPLGPCVSRFLHRSVAARRVDGVELRRCTPRACHRRGSATATGHRWVA